MDGIISNFSQTLDNSVSAIRKKRYDLVTIFGNRILSDLVILENKLPQNGDFILSFIGLFLRRVGIDLIALAQNSRDTAKLKQRAMNSISKMKEIISSSDTYPFSKALGEYQEYIEVWANEMNENDLSLYLRNGELDQYIFQWAIDAIDGISESQILVNASPIAAIDNELSRMSYVEKLSKKTLLLSISLRGLNWLSETTYQVINMSRTGSIDKDLSLDTLTSLSKQLVEFSHKVVTAFDGCKDMDANSLSENLIKSILGVGSEILLSWRKLLNQYYQFQTGFAPLLRQKHNDKNESEVQDDDK
jgi:hypothetical protein